MSDHHLSIDPMFSDLRLVCTAGPEADCRKRPEEPRESWTLDDSDLIGGQDCWAAEWVNDAGIDAVELRGEFPMIPVGIAFEDDHPVLTWAKPEGAHHA